jgi:ribulose-5-phosphate 4-epimerase/fuculose-1-phosphate aldolase
MATVTSLKHDDGSNRPHHISEEEWGIRVELAACYRIFDHIGWFELIYNHITMRVPGPETHFLINPFGLMYSEVTASNLVKIDLEGNIIGESDWPINPAGFIIHGAIHGAVPDAHCVMHTHTTAGLAVACKEDGLDWNNFYSAQIYNQVAYHDFEGITVEMEERERMLANIGDKRQIILRNHGLVSWGENIPEAFVRLWTLQRACEIQMAVEGMPGRSIPLSEEVRQQCARASFQFQKKFGGGRDVFDAMVRMIDRKDTSYKV